MDKRDQTLLSMIQELTTELKPFVKKASAIEKFIKKQMREDDGYTPFAEKKLEKASENLQEVVGEILSVVEPDFGD